MKKLFLLVSLLPYWCLAQIPSANSLVKLHSVNNFQMNNIQNPLEGSIIYNNTEKSVFQRSDSEWIKLRQTLSVNGNQLSISDGNTVTIPSINIENGTVVSNSLYYDGSNWTENNVLTIHLPGFSPHSGPSGRVGINTNQPDNTLSVNGGASKSGGGSWLTYSDRRVKKNIITYTKGIDEVMQIQPVSYHYNSKSGYSDTTKQYVGVIAQEIEKILPNTVSLFDDSQGSSGLKDKRQFDSSEIIWLMVNAIKELDQRNVALLHELKELKAKREGK